MKQRLHAVMAWAWAHGFCQANPVDVVDKLLPLQPSKAIRTQHQPAMDWRILPAFYQQYLANAERFDVSRALLSFVILTACRSGEARSMRWNELDLDAGIWTIPADRMKTQVVHRIPLSLQAMAVLEKVQGLHGEWVFPSPRKQVPLTDMAMTTLLRRVEAPSTTPGRLATAHGFRSTFRDWCSEKGYPRDLAERALAHLIQNKVEAAYHRTDLLDQRRPMMDTWAEFVSGNSPTE
nr:site-specific integrase [Aeromonas hydrophila]